MLKVFHVTIDCANPQTLAPFWTDAIGYEQAFGDDGWVSIKDPAGAGIEIGFQKVPEPKTVKNRVHLDLKVSDESVEARRASLEALGATTQRRVEEGDDFWYIMEDPEGNEFCLIPGPNSDASS